MKKLNTTILSVAALIGSAALTSCLGSGTNKYYGSGIFTVEKTGTGYNLYNDGGGMVRPSAQSVNDLVGSSGFESGQRVALDYTYEDNMFREEPGKGYYIDNVDLYQGQLIPNRAIMFKNEAESKNLLKEDSLFNIGTEISMWAYRGYITVRYNGIFSLSLGKGIWPTLNMVYDPDQNGAPNSLHLMMCYNRHTAKDATQSKQYFYNTFPLSAFNSLVSGNDSVNITVEGLGLEKPRTLRVGRQDFIPGNYVYFANDPTKQ